MTKAMDDRPMDTSVTEVCRRSLLKGGIAGGLITALSGTASAIERKAADRPNILWLVSEDNNPFIGAYGDPIARTPNLDALAKQGVLYRNVFSNAPVCAPSRFAILTGLYAETCGAAQHMRANAHLPAFIKTYPEHLRAAGYYCTNNAKTDYNCDVDPQKIWSAQGDQAHWRQRPAGMPFMSVFNFQTTHESELFKPTPGAVKPADVKLPAYLPDTPAIRQDYASYYNLMERMDAQIGASIAELEAAGLADDTIIFHYSDNGGVLPRSKRYCYDEGLRCGMIVRVPPKWAHLMPMKPGTQSQTPVSFIDLLPTLLAIANIPAPATAQGHAFLGPKAKPLRYAFGARARMDERYDLVRTVTDGRYRYIRNYMPHLPAVQYQAFAWQAAGYQDWDRLRRAGKLTPLQSRAFEPRPYEEFYDIEADRDQIVNLIDTPAHQQRLSQMRPALDAHMIEINDNGFIAEGMAVEGYEESRRAGTYPLKEIMTLAAAAAKRDPGNVAMFQQGLDHANPVHRYWSAMGLLILAAKATAAASRLRQSMQEDQSPQVRIVAAQAVAALSAQNDAVTLLADLLGPKNVVPVRLQAINALTALGDKARPALPAIKTLARVDNMFLRNAGRYLEAMLEGNFDPSMKIFDMEHMQKLARERAAA